MNIMFQDKYNNSSYWVDIHENYSGTLRAVGWPTLSEEFNKLKYYSESASFLTVLDRATDSKKACAILEVGVGTGYWTALQGEYFRKAGVDIRVTALDMSASALAQVKGKFPDISTIEADLKTIDVNSGNSQYDLVTAIMVLLHLTDIEDYLHALTFCAHSVKEGGYFILYEPLLNKGYSPFMSIEYDKFTGNSIPRASSMVDNLMQNNGLSKRFVLPGASWLLNSPIQANSKSAFKLKQLVWAVLVKFLFRSDRLTGMFSKLLLALDSISKRRDPDSGTFVLYKKQGKADASGRAV